MSLSSRCSCREDHLAARVATELARHGTDGVLAADTGLGSLPGWLGLPAMAGSSARTDNGLWGLPRDCSSQFGVPLDTQPIQTSLTTNSERVSTAVIEPRPN